LQQKDSLIFAINTDSFYQHRRILNLANTGYLMTPSLISKLLMP